MWAGTAGNLSEWEEDQTHLPQQIPSELGRLVWFPGYNQCHHLYNWMPYVTLDHTYCQFKHIFRDTHSFKIKTYHISYATCPLTSSLIWQWARGSHATVCRPVAPPNPIRNHNNPFSHYLILLVSVSEAWPDYFNYVRLKNDKDKLQIRKWTNLLSC